MTLSSPQLQQPSKPVTKAVTGKQHEQPWKVLSQFLSFQGFDHKLWWDKLAPVVGSSLSHTGYSTEAQYQNLLLIYSAIIPSLGHFSNNNVTWQSCMANHEGPLDVSVNYQQGSKSSFRITIEPIGSHAGTEADPINELAPRQLLQTLSHIQPSIDFTWFDQLGNDVLVNGHEARQHWDSISHLSCKSQTCIGLDLHEDSVTVKPYFSPLLRSAATGTDVIRTMFDSLRNISNSSTLKLALSKVEEYMSSIEHKILGEKTYLAFDCTSPAQSRVKIYTAVDMTSLEEVYDFWSLGCHLVGPEIEKGFEIVKEMWNLIYPKELPNGKRRESLTVNFNWELSPRDGSIAPKAYFLVDDDYDEHISNAVVTLFADLGWDDHIQTHKTLEKEAYSMYDFKARTDVYVWLAFAYSSSSGPYITTYTNPLAGGAKI